MDVCSHFFSFQRILPPFPLIFFPDKPYPPLLRGIWLCTDSFHALNRDQLTFFFSSSIIPPLAILFPNSSSSTSLFFIDLFPLLLQDRGFFPLMSFLVTRSPILPKCPLFSYTIADASPAIIVFPVFYFSDVFFFFYPFPEVYEPLPVQS